MTKTTEEKLMEVASQKHYHNPQWCFNHLFCGNNKMKDSIYCESCKKRYDEKEKTKRDRVL